jgi:DDB1- and CUL4-associated factor 11
VLRHRRPVSHPFPNAYSHPLPRFSYDPATLQIVVSFAFDPTYPPAASWDTTRQAWKDKTFLMTAIPMRKPKSLIDNASEMLSSAISVPFSLFSGQPTPTSPRPDDVFNTGDIDLREDEILETERSEEGEVDNSSEKHRQVRVVGIAKEDEDIAGEKTKARRQWIVIPLRSVRNRTGTL